MQDITQVVKKGELVYNVKDFGAVGSGDSDDTQAFKDFILACDRDKAKGWIPNGIYTLSEPLTMMLVNGLDIEMSNGLSCEFLTNFPMQR